MIARAAALVAILAAGLAAPSRAADASEAGLANPLAVLSLEQLSATRERPLFSPARRLPAAPVPAPAPPEPVPVAAAPAPPQPAPALALLGIIADQDGARALVRTGASSEVLRLRLGDAVESWTVAEIGRTELVLQLGDRRETVGLFSSDRKSGLAARAQKVVPPPKMAVAPVLRSTPKNFESDGL